MAKQTRFQENHHGRTRQEQAKVVATREANHSPAIERKRAENAWHTNPLAPIPPAVLRKQAANLMRTFYAPEYKSLNEEEAKTNSISEKRKADNSYYLNWLNQQSDLLNAHEEAARATVQAAGQEAEHNAQAGWADLQQQIVDNGNKEAGTVSNIGEAKEANLTGAAMKGVGEIANQREATEAQLGTEARGAAFAVPENMAQIAAMEAKRQSDLWNAHKEIGKARNELRGTQAAEAAKEYARLSDREIEKAQERASIAASEATAAIEAKRFGLDAKKAKLESEEFGFEKGYKNRKFGLENKEYNLKAEEAAVHKELEEKKITQAEAKHKLETIRVENETKKVQNEGKRTPSEKAKSREKQREKNQGINAQIETAATTIHQNPELQKLLRKNPTKAKELLHKKYGYNSIAIQVASELYLNHELSEATQSALESIGYNGKYVG